jgi:hypothetical protein
MIDSIANNHIKNNYFKKRKGAASLMQPLELVGSGGRI